MAKYNYTLTQAKYDILCGLRYRISDLDYQRTHGAEESEMEKTRDTIGALFDEADKAGIPFWVQNATIAKVQGNYRHYLQSYTIDDLKALTETPNRDGEKVFHIDFSAISCI